MYYSNSKGSGNSNGGWFSSVYEFVSSVGYGVSTSLAPSSSVYTLGSSVFSTGSLQSVIQSLCEAKSKQEEDQIMQQEVKVLKQLLQHHSNELKEASTQTMKEILIRMIYCEMMGYKVSFGYIYAINMTQQTDPLLKRLGYLTATLFLDQNHEFVILLTSSITRDLKSSNFVDVWSALCALSKVINSETIPAVVDHVVALLSHTKPLIRKKAVSALHRFWKTSPSTVEPYHDKFRIALCDSDPSVMSSALCLFYDLVQVDNTRHKDLVPTFVSILKQVAEHNLPRTYEFHEVPSPWVQIKLLQILAMLGKDDKKSSQHIYTVLEELLKSSLKYDSTIGFAIAYECIVTITSIHSNSGLLDLAASSIAAFITHDSPNIKYLGIRGLAEIVKINATYANAHQVIVIECLDDIDETIKRETLLLLYEITNPKNAVVIIEKLLQSLRTAVDEYFRRDLLEKAFDLTERYAPSGEWFVDTIVQIFQLGGEILPYRAVTNVVNVLQAENDKAETLRGYAVSIFIKILGNTKLPDPLVQLIVWTLGEYGPLYARSQVDALVAAMCDEMSRFHGDDTKLWIISSLLKLATKIGCTPSIQETALRFKNSSSIELQQRCYELLELAKYDPTRVSLRGITEDTSMQFLDSVVQLHLQQGAPGYISPQAMFTSPAPVVARKLRFSEYSAVQVNTATAESPSTATNGETSLPSRIEVGSVNIKWGPQGYIQHSASSLSPESKVATQKRDTVTEPTKPRSVLKDAKKEKTRAAIFDASAEAKADPKVWFTYEEVNQI